jgi:hypothetical protein
MKMIMQNKTNDRTYSSEDVIQYLFNKPGIHISKLYTMFKSLDLFEFNQLFSKVIEKKDYELFQQLMYFIRLFKDTPYAKEVASKIDIPLIIIEEFIHFLYVHSLLNEMDVYEQLDILLDLLKQETILKLLTRSQSVKNDELLTCYMLSKLTCKSLAIYFNTNSISNEVLHKITLADKSIIKRIFTGKIELISYLVNIYKADNNPYADELIIYSTQLV